MKGQILQLALRRSESAKFKPRENSTQMTSFYYFISEYDCFRFAYIEFVDKDSVENALKLDESLFKGRQLKVCTVHLPCIVGSYTLPS